MANRPKIILVEPPPFWFMWISGEEKDIFLENFSLLLSSGIDALSALTALEKETKGRSMKKVIRQIRANVESGSSISKALAATGLFSKNVITLIAIGEQSGRLSENLKVIVTQLDKERSFRSKVASAMLYPVFVLSLTLIVGITVSWVILPRLATVFTSLHIPLPLITKILIDLGTFLGLYGAVVVPVFIFALLIILYFLFINPGTKFIGQEMVFRVPGIDKVIQEVELARFGFLLGTLLSAGLPIGVAFDSLIEATTFLSYKKYYIFLRDRIDEGNSFEKSFALSGEEKLIPATIQQMIIAAESSGYLPDTLIKIGARYEEKTETTSKNISTILEPVLLVIVWFGVAAVALAVILPIYSLVGGISNTVSGQIAPPPVVVTPTPTPTLIPVSPTPTPTPVPPSVKVLPNDSGYLNVRQNPTTDSAVITKVSPGDIFPFKAKQNGWYKIVLPSGVLGWVNGDYVTEL